MSSHQLLINVDVSFKNDPFWLFETVHFGPDSGGRSSTGGLGNDQVVNPKKDGRLVVED